MLRQVGIRALLRSETFSTATMVRKTRSQQYQVDDDIPATQQSVNDLQAQVTALVNAVGALTTQNTTPAIRHRRNTRPSIHDDSEEEDDNPFAPLHQQPAWRRQTNNSDSDSEDRRNNPA
uniref:Uncharacterized protein n=1 Tax=Brassica oleracea var. oleracea TaxID=109376 RepID=A0A0D3AAA0_BRAOL